MKRIGIDVGGTNTDAVFIDGTRVVASVKTPTTSDVTSGVKAALALLLEKAGDAARTARAVMIGTSQFLNAVIERKHLDRVAVMRLCLPASASIRPFVDWPEDLRAAVRGEVVLLPGGFEVDGSEIAAFDDEATLAAARRIAETGTSAVVISSVFSPLRTDHEQRAAEILRSVAPHVRIGLSHEFGRIGLLERENVSIMNAALGSLAKRTIRAFEDAIVASSLDARLYLTQNDGTVMAAERAERFPVLCFSSGVTNSIRGAAFLSGLDDAAVVDVGGTTSDIGMLTNGFPREANTIVHIGGVRTLFRMPEVISLPLGGGTRVRTDPMRLGPDSLGFRLLTQGRVFGGPDLCMTDVAVAHGLATLGDPRRVRHLDSTIIDQAFDESRQRLEDGIDRIKIQSGDVPLIAVGGASFLVPQSLKGISEVIVVPYHDVANAVGAAMAQVGSDVDQVFRDLSRDEAIAAITEIAKDRAVQAGAVRATIIIVDVEEVPLAYATSNCRRVRIRVTGELADG